MFVVQSITLAFTIIAYWEVFEISIQYSHTIPTCKSINPMNISQKPKDVESLNETNLQHAPNKHISGFLIIIMKKTISKATKIKGIKKGITPLLSFIILLDFL